MRVVLLLLTVLFYSVAASAHFDFGLYTGLDKAGNVCSINFLKKEYVNGIKNPLNEKVFVVAQIEGTQLSNQELVHPMTFDKQTKTIGFDHDHLQSYYGTQTGAVLVKVSIHEQNGPDHFHIFSTNWKDGTNSSKDCINLTKVVQ